MSRAKSLSSAILTSPTLIIVIVWKEGYNVWDHEGPLLHTHCHGLSLLSVCVSAGVVSWRVRWVKATSDAGRAPAVTQLTAARTPVGLRWRHRHRRDTTEQQIFFKVGKYFYTKGNIFNQATFKWPHKASTTVWASWICSRFKEPEKKHFYSWCRLSI